MIRPLFVLIIQRVGDGIGVGVADCDDAGVKMIFSICARRNF